MTLLKAYLKAELNPVTAVQTTNSAVAAASTTVERQFLLDQLLTRHAELRVEYYAAQPMFSLQ